MKLVHLSTKAEVKVGDKVKLSDGLWYVQHWDKPHSPASTGRVYVSKKRKSTGHDQMGYYPSVCNCEWIEREDR